MNDCVAVLYSHVLTNDYIYLCNQLLGLWPQGHQPTLISLYFGQIFCWTTPTVHM